MTLPSKSIVVTGFEPYGGRRINPAAEVSKALDAQSIDGFAVIGAILPVSQRSLRERFGLNLLDFGIADNDGARLADALIEANGVTGVRSSLPLRGIERALLGAGIPARLSSSAGTFLCNAALYSLMRILEERFPTTLGGFIHLPYLPEQVAQLLADGKRDRRPESNQRSDIASMDLATQIRAVRIALAETVGALTARG